MNYKQLIRNEYEMAKLNTLNQPFNTAYQNRFFAIAKIYRQVNRKAIGCDSMIARELYDQMRGIK